MSPIQKGVPITLEPNIRAALPGDVAQVLAGGVQYVTPGGMVWHGFGPVDAPALILLHGGSGSWTHWVRNIAPWVAKGRRVLVPDLPGFGDSAAPPSGWDADAMVAPLQQGFLALKQNEQTDVVGFSFGAMTAALWLAQHPGVAKQLVMVGAPGLGLTVPDRVALKAWRHLRTAPEQEAAHRHNLLTLMLHKTERLDALAMAVHTGNVVRDRMLRRRLSQTLIVAETLPLLPCMVHVIYGEFDALYRGRLNEVQALMRQTVPRWGSWQVIGGAGHWVQFEAPEAFHEALTQALL